MYKYNFTLGVITLLFFEILENDTQPQTGRENTFYPIHMHLIKLY